jgi:hypothetical protein
MGLFARFTCLRREGTAHDFAPVVSDLLRVRNVAETPDPTAAERLLMIAPAGDGWLMVFDHVEEPSAAMGDADGLLQEVGTAGNLALDIFVADSDDLVLMLNDGGEPQARPALAIGHRGLESGALEPWQRLLLPGQSVDDIGKAFAKRTTFVEEHFPALKPLFGIDLAAFNEVGKILSGQPSAPDVVLLRLKAIPAAGQVIGPPRLEVDETHRRTMALNRDTPRIPRGLVTHFPAFSFNSRGGGARGLEVRLSGSGLKGGFIEIVSAMLRQDHPTERNLNQDIKALPEMTPAGVVLRFPELEVPDWVQPDVRTAMRARRALQDLMMWVYARGMKVGDAELEAEAHLVAPKSAPVRTSYPVTVLPEMWHPLKRSEQPNMIQDVLSLNRPARVNGLAVLRGGPDAAVSALRRALETWRSLVDPSHRFAVAAATDESVSATLRRALETLRSLSGPAHVPAATKPANEVSFFWPADSVMPFKLDLSKKRQAKWDRFMADLPSLHGLRITTDIGHGLPREEHAQHYARRVVLQYTSAAEHPRLPEYAARLGHLSLSAAATPEGELALVSLIRVLAADGFVGQAYVAAWDHDDEPKNTLYERAGDIFVHQRTAQGWGTRYLRAVADRMWLGPEFAAMLPDRAALERVAIVVSVGDTLAIERRPEATLRDLELCLEPMLASKTESQAFRDRFKVRPPQ